MKLLTSITILALTSSGAIACSVSPSGLAVGQLLDFNKPVRAANDCSFENAGVEDNISGSAAVDEGQGFVTQVVEEYGQSVCYHSRSEQLIISDCANGSVSTISGRATDEPIDPSAPPVVMIGGTFTVENTLSVIGEPLFVNGRDMNGILELAEQKNIRTGSHVILFDEIEQDWDRPGNTCGCDLYYPNSAGASQ